MNLSKLKVMQLIHVSFCLFLVLFGLTVFFLGKETMYFNLSADSGKTIYPLFPIMTIILLLLGSFLYNRLLADINLQLPFEEKLTWYQVVFIIRAAFFEVSGLMNIVGFIVSKNSVFLIIAGIVMVVFTALRPTKNSLINALNLRYPDTENL